MEMETNLGVLGFDLVLVQVDAAFRQRFSTKPLAKVLNRCRTACSHRVQYYDCRSKQLAE